LVSKSVLRKEYNLWILLNHTRHAIYRARELELGRYGITNEQARLLFAVNMLKEKATPTEIAKQAFRETHTISSLVDRMAKKDLVKRVKDQNSKKIVRIVLTDEGKRILQQAMERESLHKIISSLSETQYEQVKECLKILMQHALRELKLQDKRAVPQSPVG
jgi:DNA-binding MarR family transcriptional regulator